MKHLTELQALSPWVAAFGIAPTTHIATPDGPRVAGSLRVGDLVDTFEDGPLPLTDVRETVSAPSERNHYPVRITQGALGFGVPHADLDIGPQHRVLFRHIRVPLLFGEDAVLVRGKSLAVSHDGITVLRTITPATYVQ
ncbi:MAG: Hint domain-containing protein, partial [Octadecabacter sp.]|nr:Hint domain-containing protein [Octadecabacter sp.]